MTTEPKKTIPYGGSSTDRGHGPHMFEGRLVSMTGDKLVMTNPEGKEFSHTLARDAKLTCDGADCRSSAMKVGNRIRVTTKKDDRNVATCVETIDKEAKFTSRN